MVQAYQAHGGRELKVYCIGERVHVFGRAIISLDGAGGPGRGEGGLPVTSFDSQDVKGGGAGEAVSAEDRAVLLACARWLRKAIGGVNLFGFDALKVKGESQSRLAIIDVNYFPSFKGMPEAQAHLHESIRAVLGQGSAGAGI